MGCGKSKLDVASDATITKTKSRSKSLSKRTDQGPTKVARDVKTVPDKVENGNKAETAVLAPQQTGGGSEKVEDKTEKPKEETPAGAGDVAAENAGAEEVLDVDKKDDSNSLKIKGEAVGATKVVFIEPAVVVEKAKDVAEAKAPIVEEKAPVEETKTETVKEEAPEMVKEKEAEVVPEIAPEASTPAPPQASAAPAEEKKETETIAVPVKTEAAEEEKETEAVAAPVQPEAAAEPAEEKKEKEAVAVPVEPEASAATAAEQETAPAVEETVAPAAESPATDTKTN